MRRLRTALLLAAASWAGAALYRRRETARRPRVDLYDAAGGITTLETGSPEGERLLALAREILAA